MQTHLITSLDPEVQVILIVHHIEKSCLVYEYQRSSNTTQKTLKISEILKMLAHRSTKFIGDAGYRMLQAPNYHLQVQILQRVCILLKYS